MEGKTLHPLKIKEAIVNQEKDVVFLDGNLKQESFSLF